MKKMLLIAVVVACLSLSSLTVVLASTEVLFEDDFSDPTFTKDAWTFLIMDQAWGWADTEFDTQAKIEDGVLSITNLGSGTLAFMLQTKEKYEDFTAEFKVRVFDFGDWGHAGIRFRFVDPANSYMYIMGKEDPSVRIYDPAKGDMAFPGSIRIQPFETGKWYVLKLEARGEEVKGYADDQLVGTYRGVRQQSGTIVLYAITANIEVDYIRITK